MIPRGYAGEDVWLPVIDTAVRDLGRASSALSEKRNPEAAAAIRDAASFFTAEAESGPGEARAKLKGAAAKLERLAAELETGSPPPHQDEVVRVLENLGGSISTLGEMLKTPAPA